MAWLRHHRAGKNGIFRHAVFVVVVLSNLSGLSQPCPLGCTCPSIKPANTKSGIDGGGGGSGTRIQNLPLNMRNTKLAKSTLSSVHVSSTTVDGNFTEAVRVNLQPTVAMTTVQSRGEGSRGTKGSRRGTKVDCSNNPAPFTSLDQIQPNSMPLNTVHLDLSNNVLVILRKGAFNSLSMLRKLILSDNQISRIEAGAFHGLNMLEKLDLSGNRLAVINISVFAGLPKLQRLSLSRNRLATIPEGTFNNLPSLRRIDFQSDKLRCDCHMEWIVQWAKDKNVKISKSTTCAIPEEVTGKPLRSLKKKHLHCEYPLDLDLFEMIPFESQIVFEGDKLPFECRASVTNPKTSMTWLRKGFQVNTNRTAGIYVHTSYTPNKKVMIHSLILENLERKHSGIWQCQVSTPHGNRTNPVNIIVIADNATTCPQMTVRTNKGLYMWPKTVAGIQIELKCKMNPSNALAKYMCTSLGTWHDLDTSQCQYVSDTTRRLQSLAMRDITAHNVVGYTREMKGTLKKASLISDPVDVGFVSHIIAKIAPHSDQSNEIPQTLLDVASLVMEADPALLKKAQQEDHASTRIVRNLEHVAEMLLTNNKRALRMSSSIAIAAQTEPTNAFAGVSCVASTASTSGTDKEQELQTEPEPTLERVKPPGRKSHRSKGSKNKKGEGDGGGGGHSRMDEETFSCSSGVNQTFFSSLTTQHGVHSAVRLPKSIFDRVPVLEGVSTGLVGVYVIVYRHAGLFPMTSSVHSDAQLITGTWRPVSPVIGASVEIDFLPAGQSIANLTDPIVIVLEVTSSDDQLVAAHWDSELNNGRGDWRTDGCHIVQQQGNLTTAHCSHLTNFVILQGKGLVLIPILRMLHPVIYAGSCVLVVCLMALIASYTTCYRMIQIPKKSKHSVINISASILLLCVAFTMGVNRTDRWLICQIVKTCIHYFTLCAIFWITIAANNMLKKFSKAERPPEPPPPDPMTLPLPPKPILRFYFLGWGVPIIICGITAAVNIHHYVEVEYCFLPWEPSLGAFYGPVALLVIINLVFFMRISFIIRGTPSSTTFNEEAEDLHTNEIELTPNPDAIMPDIQTDDHADDSSDISLNSSVLDLEYRPINQLRALVATLFLYIVMWVCGAFAIARPFRTIIPHQEIIFSYLYSAMCLLLGVFLLSYYCLMRQDVRSCWRRFFCCESQMYSVGTDNHMTHANGHAIQSASSIELAVNSKTVNVHHCNQLKEAIQKTSNINLISSHNPSVTEGSVVSASENYPNFYNPRQNGVAKKFWSKRQNHVKLINKDFNNIINTGSSSYNSHMDNFSDLMQNKRNSNYMSSDANTHFSIEIQIQANPHWTTNDLGVAHIGHRSSGLESCDPPVYSSVSKAPPLPVNLHNNVSAFQRVIPGQIDDRFGSPDGGGPISVCSSSQYPLSQSDCLLCSPLQRQSPSSTSLGACTQTMVCTCGANTSDNSVSRYGRVSSPVSSMNNPMMQRSRDFDGQSEVSTNIKPLNSGGPLDLNSLRIDSNKLTNTPAASAENSPRKGLRNIDSYNSSVISGSNRLLDSRRSSDSSRQPPASDYSSDNNRHRQKKFLKELQQRVSVDQRALSPTRSDFSQSNASSRNLRHESDSNLHSYTHARSIDSDHNSEPTHRKRHHRSHHHSPHRHPHHHRRHHPRSGSRNRSTSWEDHVSKFRRPRQVPYAYVSPDYKENIINNTPSAKLSSLALLPASATTGGGGTSIASSRSAVSSSNQGGKWFPRSHSAYDQVLLGGMEALADDTSSSSDDSLDDDIWVLHKQKTKKMKKETSV